jgi:hypothetical protein
VLSRWAGGACLHRARDDQRRVAVTCKPLTSWPMVVAAADAALYAAKGRRPDLVLGPDGGVPQAA